MRKYVVISLAMLFKANACEYERDKFYHTFGERLVFTSRSQMIQTAKQYAQDFDFQWAIPMLLPLDKNSLKTIKKMGFMLDLAFFLGVALDFIFLRKAPTSWYEGIVKHRNKRIAVLFAKAMWKAS